MGLRNNFQFENNFPQRLVGWGWVPPFRDRPLAGRLTSPRSCPSRFLSPAGWRVGWAGALEVRQKKVGIPTGPRDREPNRTEQKNWRQWTFSIAPCTIAKTRLPSRNAVLERRLSPRRPVLESRSAAQRPLTRVVGGWTGGARWQMSRSVSLLSPSDTPRPFFQK